MSDDPASDLGRELLDDFYAECDELFGQIRIHLAALEAMPSDAAPSMEALYRSVHSFKGNCGIVGLGVAERLAHAAEDVLRHFISSRSTPLAPALVLLAKVLNRLEQTVAAHRLGKPPPEIADLLSSLANHGPASPSEADSASPGPRGEETPPAAASGSPASDVRWLVRFTPSSELDGRGVNVGAIRQRLSSLGVLERTEPRVLPGGGIRFEFALRLAGPPPADLDAWRADGVEFSAESPAGAPSAAAPALSIAPSHIVRVDLGRLDDLMRIMGEMVIHRSRLEERVGRLEGDRSGLEEVGLAITRSLRDLRTAIMRVRMVPVAEIFTRMPFAVRDLARDQGKNVRLALHGQGTEIDKYLVERLKEPLLHLVRNAISHGIEPPAERAEAGKAAEAVLSLRATTTGQAVILEVEDDGRGVDAAKVVARARSLGLSTPAEPTEAELLALLCQPGFSTRDEADLGSGRGMGMAAVHAALRELGGVLTLATQAGRSTRFTLRLPLTLSIIDTFIVSVGGHTCAVPRAMVEEIVQFEEAQVSPVKQTEVIPYRDGVLPLVRLAGFLRETARARVRVPALVLASERGLAGLVVDRVHAHREVVVRPMTDPLLRVPGVAGATELGDGRPVLILDPTELVRGAVRPRPTATPSAPALP